MFLGPFDISQLIFIFEHFLTFWLYKMIHAHFVYSCSSLRISHFQKETWVFLLKRTLEAKIWVLDVLIDTRLIFIFVTENFKHIQK